ncbi:MAG: replication-associated recombination protein A [Planctomycetota bacterium]|jgi:putative ATPase
MAKRNKAKKKKKKRAKAPKRSSNLAPKSSPKRKRPKAKAAKPRAAGPPPARTTAAAPSPALHEPRPPLADRMRPRDFGEFVGQPAIAGEGALLRRAIETGELTSVILWGPPGTGKTSLAHVIARLTDAHFVAFSAVLSGVAEVRRIVAEAKERLELEKRKTILFVDEIHRFNKAQQDAFLLHVEAGTIVLVGATTENPSFELTGQLLSRCRVFKLELLRPDEVRAILERALHDEERGLGGLGAEVDDDAMDFLVNYSNGDARSGLNALELAVTAGKLAADGTRRVTRAAAEEAMQRKAVLYDKGGEEHYNIISALHKSLRGSDVQAALYWLARMLGGGEDPLYILRRLVRFAAEDVGLADPEALRLAVAARDAYHFVGLPEGELFLAELVAYLAAAPKSNAIYVAMNEVKRAIEERPAEPVPLHIRNAPTRLMRELGYGKGYRYDHDEPGRVSPQELLPESVAGSVWYRPGAFGFEKEMARRIAYWERMRARARGEEPPLPDDDADPAPHEPERDGEPPLA